MTEPIRILMVEDSEEDAELLQLHFKKHGLQAHTSRVQTGDELKNALQREDWDIVLADYRLPSFTGLDAIRVLRAERPDIPIILVSGTIGEDVAVEAMKTGAHDYILKHSLTRLVPSIEHAVQDARNRREKEAARKSLLESQSQLAAIIESAMDAVIAVDQDDTIVIFNPAAEKMFGYTADEISGLKLSQLIAPTSLPIHQQFGTEGTRSAAPPSMRIDNPNAHCIRKNGEIFPIEASLAQYQFGDKTYFAAIVRDITERLKTEEENRKLTARLRVIAHITSQLSSVLDIKKLAGQIVQAIPEIIPCYNASLMMIVDGELEVLAANTDGRENPALVGIRITTERGILGLVARTGQLYVANDVSQDPHYWYYEGLPHTGSELTVPIIFEHRVRGILDVESREKNAFSQSDQEAMSIFADQLAVALQNASLFEEKTRRAAELERIAQFSTALRAADNRQEIPPILVEQTVHQLEASDGLMIKVEPSLDLAEVEWAVGRWQSLIGLRTNLTDAKSSELLFDHPLRVFNSIKRGSHLLVKGEKPAKSIACAALLAEGKAIGSLWIGQEAEFSEQQCKTLSAFAEIGAIAMHRTSLNEQTQRRLAHISALQQIDQSISNSKDLEKTLQLICQQTRDQLLVDAVDILLYNPATHQLEFKTGIGFSTSGVYSHRQELGRGLSGKAAMSDEVTFIADLRSLSSYGRAEMFREEHFVSYFGVPLKTNNELKGLLEIFHRSPINSDSEWMYFLEGLAGQAAIAIDNAEMFDTLIRKNAELMQAYDATIVGWSRALELRDRETEGHSQRVTNLTVYMARQMGIQGEALVHVRRGALLHDIGKMGIPDSILNKPGPLTDEEWAIMREHPVLAYSMIYPIEFLRPALDIPYCHHEKWDGTGYPRKLKGKAIPLAARIFAIIDVWDALSSERPYRPAWDRQRIWDYLKEQSGKHFDPEVVDLFLKILPELQDI